MKPSAWMRVLSYVVIAAMLAGMATPAAASSSRYVNGGAERFASSGQAIEVIIGSEGGEFYSEDGRLHVTVPHGAVTQPVAFSL